MNNEERLKDAATEIAITREELEMAEKARSEAYEVLYCTEQWGLCEAQDEGIHELKTFLSSLEVSTRELIAQHAEETGEKKPIKGLSAVASKVVDILDEKKTRAWLSENAPDVLTINKSKLKKAVVNLSLDFIRITETFSGRIASDLSEYLVEDEDE